MRQRRDVEHDEPEGWCLQEHGLQGSFLEARDDARWHAELTLVTRAPGGADVHAPHGRHGHVEEYPFHAQDALDHGVGFVVAGARARGNVLGQRTDEGRGNFSIRLAAVDPRHVAHPLLGDER